MQSDKDKKIIEEINRIVGDIEDIPLEKQVGYLKHATLKDFDTFKRKMNISVGRPDLNEEKA